MRKKENLYIHMPLLEFHVKNILMWK